jgi:uncharacterized protein YndB with AHSA1/START domain
MADAPLATRGAAAEADRTLVIERDFPATPDRVFAAWTDPAVLVRWWGPEGMGTPTCEMDLRPGGRYRTSMASPKGDSHTVSGVYQVIEPPHRLVFTWAWEQDDGGLGHETLVEVALQPIEGGTRLRLTQKLFQSAEQCGNHRIGWESSFQGLERLFA